MVQRLRRLGVIQQDALLSEVRKLLNAGLIYLIEDSEWVSSIVLTPKKNGKWRVCVDYKPLNAATKRDHFPLPFQDEILNEVEGYERYTMCDGYSGYFQIRIAEEDQKKTTFVTPWGCFAYRVMPFGLTNALATFQRFVTDDFQPFFGKSIRIFIDDFCIYSSRVLHLEKVNEGLARLQSLVGGQLNVDKCHIAESQVTLLGHVVYSRGIEADPCKVQALVSLPSPKSARELVSFIQKDAESWAISRLETDNDCNADVEDATEKGGDADVDLANDGGIDDSVDTAAIQLDGALGVARALVAQVAELLRPLQHHGGAHLHHHRHRHLRHRHHHHKLRRPVLQNAAPLHHIGHGDAQHQQQQCRRHGQGGSLVPSSHGMMVCGTIEACCGKAEL
ncbi:hypothetical protein L7F22_064918 [Adiantum nelumboides]|nr:hypothetical protein [Adiantum nelumboides]